MKYVIEELFTLFDLYEMSDDPRIRFLFGVKTVNSRDREGREFKMIKL
jgi:hypothetical protein